MVIHKVHLKLLASESKRVPSTSAGHVHFSSIMPISQSNTLTVAGCIVFYTKAVLNAQEALTACHFCVLGNY